MNDLKNEMIFIEGNKDNVNKLAMRAPSHLLPEIMDKMQSVYESGQQSRLRVELKAQIFFVISAIGCLFTTNIGASVLAVVSLFLAWKGCRTDSDNSILDYREILNWGALKLSSIPGDALYEKPEKGDPEDLHKNPDFWYWWMIEHIYNVEQRHHKHTEKRSRYVMFCQITTVSFLTAEAFSRLSSTIRAL